jgi:hypothetical protein
LSFPQSERSIKPADFCVRVRSQNPDLHFPPKAHHRKDTHKTLHLRVTHTHTHTGREKIAVRCGTRSFSVCYGRGNARLCAACVLVLLSSPRCALSLVIAFGSRSAPHSSLCSPRLVRLVVIHRSRSPNFPTKWLRTSPLARSYIARPLL